MKAVFKEFKCDRKNQTYVGGECITGTLFFEGGRRGCSIYDLKLKLVAVNFKTTSVSGTFSTSQLDINKELLKESVHVFTQREDVPIQIPPHTKKQLQFSIKVDPNLESSFLSLKMPPVANVYALRLIGSVQPKLCQGFLVKEKEIILHQKPITIIKSFGCSCRSCPTERVEVETFWRCAKIKAIMTTNYAISGDTVYLKMVYIDEPKTKDHPEVADVQINMDVTKYLPSKEGRDEKCFVEKNFKVAKVRWWKFPLDLEKEPKTFFKGKFRVPFVIPPMYANAEEPESATIELKHRIVICLKVGNDSTSVYKLNLPIVIGTRISEDMEQKNKIAASYYNMMCSTNLEPHDYDVDFDTILLLTNTFQRTTPIAYRSNWSIHTLMEVDEDPIRSFNSNTMRNSASAPDFDPSAPKE